VNVRDPRVAAAARTDLPAPSLPPGRPRLVVTGFMGTGKTVAGRLAAERLGLPFVDLDDAIQRRAGASIPEIFSRVGEGGFRALERDAVADAVRLSATVIATGGGAALDDETFAALAEGADVSVLTCAPETLAARLTSAGPVRPLLEGATDTAERIRELLASRAARYEAAGPPLDTTDRMPDQVAGELVDRYLVAAGHAAAPARIEVRGPNGPYPVVVGPGALAHLPETLTAAVPEARRVVVVVDGAAVATAGSTVADALVPAGLDPLVLELPAGEAAKTIGIVASLWDRFRRAGLSREDVVVAVGGGAALDAAGFAAATFGRGVALLNVPTTLLAMVDAGVGGKVAIDHAGAKNLVGAFHHPVAVVVDPVTLMTVPADAIRQGLAEAIKSFVLASPLALDVVEAAAVDDRALPSPPVLAWLIEQAVRVKAAYVAEDPEDRGLRHALNLGHTFAHAVESASGYAVPHGVAVAMGIVAAARLGEDRGVTRAGTSARLLASVGRFGLPAVAPPGLDRAAMLGAVGDDKKRRGGRAVFVVPAPGGCAVLEGVDPAEALSFLDPGDG
jgi:shikimate kinase/3-dehydroquinate synthase